MSIVLEKQFAELVAQSTWRHPVNDPPPYLIDVLVLVFDDFDGELFVDLGFRGPKNRWLLTGSREIYLCPIGWMPLPTVPTRETFPAHLGKYPALDEEP